MSDNEFGGFDLPAGSGTRTSEDPLADFVDIIGDEKDDFIDLAAVESDDDVFSKVIPMPGVGGDLASDPLDSAEVGAIESMLEELIAQLLEAKTMPLSQNVLVNKAAFITNLERILSLLPEEVRAARWMIREQEAFVARANEKSKEIMSQTNQKAHAIMENARHQADLMVSQSNIVAEAVEEANILVRNAEGEGRRIRLQAEDYSEDRLVQLEHLFGNLVRQVRETRSEFHQARPAAGDVPILD